MEEASERHGDEPGPAARGKRALGQELFVVVVMCLSLLNIYIYIWLHRVLVGTYRIASALRIFSCALGTLSCGTQDPVP